MDVVEQSEMNIEHTDVAKDIPVLIDWLVGHTEDSYPKQGEPLSVQLRRLRDQQPRCLNIRFGVVDFCFPAVASTKSTYPPCRPSGASELMYTGHRNR